MKMLHLLLALAAVLFSSQGFPQPGNGIESVDDWARQAQLARAAGLPIMIIFSADDCAYCERLKQEVVMPQLQQGGLQDKVRIGEFNIHRGGKIIDFDGEQIRSRIFVSRYEIFATPTVILLDPQGHPLTDPLVGFDNARDYIDKLENAIDSAFMSLAASHGPHFAYHHRPAESDR